MSSSHNPQCHSRPTISCGDCRLSGICLPISLHLEDINRLNDIVKRGRPLQKGNHVYRAYDAFSSVYAVRSGAIKTFTLSDSGEEQVTGFYLPGEILGMDGIGDEHYTNSAIALETSAVCEIPFTRMEELSLAVPSLQRRFFQLMSKEITNEQQLISLVGKSSAEARIAAVLLSISTRHHQRQLSASTFSLPMSRTDLANYLGLTIETTSRIFSRLNKQALIKVNKKEIEILDFDALRTMAGTSNC